MDARSLIVGRDPDCDVRLAADDTRISRKHARLTPLGDGRFQIEDLGSPNGVSINGRRIQTGVFGRGDRVTFGSFVFDPTGIGGTDPWRTIGRDPECGVVIPLDAPGVSRVHARFRAGGPGAWLVEDAGSANGLFVNGHRVSSATVTARDQVSLGSWRLDPSLLRTPIAPFEDPSPPTPPPPIPIAPASSRSLYIALATAALLAVGIGVAAAQGILPFHSGPRPVSPQEAIAKLDEAIHAGHDLPAHLSAYSHISQDIEPIRARILVADDLVKVFEEVRSTEVLGVNVWAQVRARSPAAQIAEEFVDHAGAMVHAARSLADRVATLPIQGAEVLGRMEAARASPTIETVASARVAMRDTASAFTSVEHDLGPPHDAVREVEVHLQKAEEALRSYGSEGFIGSLCVHLASGVEDLQLPVEKADKFLGDLRVSLTDDVATLTTADQSLAGIEIR